MALTQLVVRFVLGGLFVSAFALAGEIWKPKTFAGIFGAAPAVALASLGLAYLQSGAGYVVIEARSMSLGALALVIYSTACIDIVRRRSIPVGVAAFGSWGVWLASAFVLRVAARFTGADAVKPRIDSRALQKTKAWEHALRFGFGGTVAVGTGLIAQHWGPSIGGLFLAFPAVLPAGLTLVKQHARRRDVVADAYGARVGAWAMVLFGGSVMLLGEQVPPALALSLATVVWGAASYLAWLIVYGRDAY